MLLADRREEKPIKILYNKNREILINDVLEIKRDVDFKPRYNIAPHCETTRQRPTEFAGGAEGFEQWLKDIKTSHIKVLAEQKLAEKMKAQWVMTIEFDYAPKIMKRFMKVD